MKNLYYSAHYDKFVTVDIPADHDRKSLDDGHVIARVVESGLLEAPCVLDNQVRGRFNEFAYAMERLSPQERCEAAIKLAGIALRYAWENRRDLPREEPSS